ncbi:universal stress protein [Natronococcus occultus]|uniref:Universal stress protein UspA-like protein n=1 Tax=Natronococcus occultus SP4 TaxID=694430 RepID=L0K2U2_9EURY|nr:universal stress protein [Natronococcus occultus]AGB39632.1 universal stress protein UspA-like protein [Natronococcus occultus SP4]
MTTQLLVPVDDSEPARAALEYALERFPDDEITVVHAIDDLEAGYAGEPSAAATEERQPDVFEDARALADERDTRIETRVLEGQAADAILECVVETDADAIVMGSEGRSGVSRMLLGSVAEQVARQSPVPVTIVPNGS